MLSMFLSVVGYLGITSHASSIQAFPWVTAKTSVDGYEMYMGVTAKAEHMDCSIQSFFPDTATCAAASKPEPDVPHSNSPWTDDGNGQFSKVTKFSDADDCGRQSEGEEAFLSPEQQATLAQISKQCLECKEHALTSGTLVIGIITTWPNILTDLQRTTRFGDVNCQAASGVMGTLFGVILNTMSQANYARACKTQMPTSIQNFDGSLEKIEWSYGIGYLSVLMGTVIKILDALCHLMIPTPEGRWTKPVSPPASTLEYLMLTSPQQKSMGGGPDAHQIGVKAEAWA